MEVYPYLSTLAAFINLQTVVLLFIGFVFAFLLLKSNKKFKKLPPGPRGWPIIGSLLHFDKELYLSFDKWGKEYGDIFTVNFGWRRPRAVILNSAVAVKSLLKDQGDKIANRPQLPLLNVSFTVQGSIVAENGHDWNERRRWGFGVLRNLSIEKNLENRISIEADYLCQEFEKYRESFNPLHCVNNAVANIICTISFGDRFEYSDEKFKELIGGMRYLFESISITNPINVFPLLYYTPFFRKFRKSVENTKVFLNDEVHQHEETFDPGHIRDFIDAYILKSKKKDVDLNVFGIDLLWRTVLDLFFAGTDTTTCTMMWIIVYLVNYPDVQKKVQEEIDNVLGQGKKPTWSNRRSMPFLEATIMEIQRLCNAIPLFGRDTTEEIYIEGYKIPPKISVFTNIWSVHTDSNQWERPLEFQPERFLTSDDLSRSSIKMHEAFMPFGAGRRLCIGEQMARMELFLFTANLMQRFTFGVADGEPIPSVNACVPGLTRFPKPYQIVANKR